MRRANYLSIRTCFFVLFAVVLSCAVSNATEPAPEEDVSLTVVVKEADTGDPIVQARLTLSFQRPGHGIHRTKNLSYGAKTNLQGRYKFTDIPKGTIHLSVTADHRQSYGKDIDLEQNGQVIEVKLKKPQPVL
jgi:hypothetical protein